MQQMNTSKLPHTRARKKFYQQNRETERCMAAAPVAVTTAL
jgi:hypothetical protein